MIARACAVLAAALLLPPAALAQDVPQPDGWVTDLGGFLDERQEQALETLMQSYKAGSGNEIALLTVPDLAGRPVERYALEVARQWGLGEKDKHNGALLLVARAERKLRIEVGRGLEGTLTDSISGRIIRDVITPRFKQGDYYAGLRAGIEAMHAAAGGDYGKIPPERDRARGVLSLLPLLFFFLLFLLTRGGRGGRGRGGGILPWLILGSMHSRGRGSSPWRGGGFSGGGFGGGGGFSGGGASGGW